jgi:two-component system response regulator HydG
MQQEGRKEKTPSALTLLVASEASPECTISQSLIAGRFLVHSVSVAQVESWLAQSDADAVVVYSDRGAEELTRLVRIWKSIRPRAQFVLLLARAPSARELVALMHAGYQDVLEQAAADMSSVLQSLEERVRYVRVRQMERLQVKQSIQYAGLIGESPEMVRIYDEIVRTARLNCPVLLLGETGTGKGLVAHAIHALSHRSGRAFVTVDCACLAPTLIESELYGVARGAYTGATADRSGLVEAAQHGTLFLDEVGELPLGMQPKLLRLLEEREVRRLGSPRSTPVDVRIISATSRRLEALIAADQFRLDLYYRLNVLAIEIPPLRQRLQDVPLLARHFASRHLVHGRPAEISGAAAAVLLEYSWPGNVRELKNCVEAALARAGGNVIQVQHLPSWFGRGAEAGGSEQERLNLKQIERRTILRALDLAANDKRKAARWLGIGKTTLYRKLKQMTGSSRTASAPAKPGYVM